MRAAWGRGVVEVEDGADEVLEVRDEGELASCRNTGGVLGGKMV